uniref:Uncharacterized protein n=1 Tax=Arundo donax TaxID=35708 RepID=A0A0A8ZXW9_ARUDO
MTQYESAKTDRIMYNYINVD